MAKKPATSKKSTSVKQDGPSLIIPNEKITITLPKKQVSTTYQAVLASLSKQVASPGFRKGKVPQKVAEEKLGTARIIERVLDSLLPDAYRQALTEAKKQPITQPEFSLVSTNTGEDWVIEAQFAELPEVKLTGYKKAVKKGLKASEKSITEAKKAAKKDKKELTEAQEKELKLQPIFRELVSELKPQVPELLLKHETQHEYEHLAGQLKQLNMSVDDYLKKRGMGMDQFSQELAVSTLSRLQLDLILGAIAKEQKLTVTDKDRDEYFKQIPDEKQREQLRKDSHYLSHLDTNLMKQKVVDYLLAL